MEAKEVKKTQDEIDKMIEALEAEVERVPPTNVFGDSNKEQIDEIEEWIDQLTNYPNVKQTNGEVIAWLKGHFSSLNDCV